MADLPPVWSPSTLGLLRVRKFGLFGFIAASTLFLCGSLWFTLALPFAIAGRWERPSVLVWPGVAATAVCSLFYFRIWLLPEAEAEEARQVVGKYFLWPRGSRHQLDAWQNPLLGCGYGFKQNSARSSRAHFPPS